MSTSPTQLSKKMLEKDGYLVAIVERWNPHAKIRQDLFGFVDLLALGHGHAIAVQTTSEGHVRDHIAKIRASEHLPRVLRSGIYVHVHGWRKNARGRWECRTEVIR